MKKHLSVLLILLTAVLVLAGCARRGATPSQTPGSVSPIPTLSSDPTDVPATPTDTPSPTPTDDPDAIYGFKEVESRDFALIQSKVTVYEHIKTGAKFVYIANEDTNRAFQLTFNTRPIDDTGIPHVFEHSCLCGSKKYPYDQLWWAVSYQTYNTYVNAYTTDAMTSYPVGSLSEAQLLKLAEYYTDACYYPLILENEDIFRTESWRYRLNSADDDLTIEGTVYSEMQGAYTLARYASQMAYQTAFPGSVLGYSYGGNPDHIPEMTWEAVKNFHSLYYHPSNSIAFLYGKFEDYTAYLKLLNDYYKDFEKSDFVFEDTGYKQITSSVFKEFAYPVSKDSDTKDQAEIDFYLIIPGLRDDKEQENVIDNLCSLLSSQSSVLGKKIKKAFPQATFSVGREVAGVDDALVVTVGNVNKGYANRICNMITSSFEDVAANGFADDLVDSYMSTINLSTKLSQEESDPIEGILYSMAYDYAVTGDVFRYMEAVENYENLASMNSGAYQAAAKKWLVGNERYAVTTTYPEAGLKETKDEELKAKLATIKSAMTAEEIQAIVDATNAPEETEDFSEAIAYLKAVTVDSLPEETRIYEVNDVTGEDGIRRIDAVANVDGVGTASVYIDAKGLKQDDIHWFRLFTRLLGKLDTDKHTKDELPILMSRYLYDGSFGINTESDSDFGNGFSLAFVAGWTALDEDLEAGYDLVKEIVFNTKFDNVAELLDKVKAQKTSVRSSINSSSYSIALYRALGTELSLPRFLAYTNYIEYYQFLERIEAMLVEGSEEPGKRLAAIQEFLNNKTNGISTFAGSKESIAVNRPLADKFFAELKENPDRQEVVYDLPGAAPDEALIIDSNVQFNCLVADYYQLELDEYDAAMGAITSLVSDLILVPILRDGYGVYTPWNEFMPAYGMYLITYRDPNIRETYEVYSTLADKIAELDIDQETLNGYILSAYSEYAKPQGELAGAVSAIYTVLAGEEQGATLECMKELKAVTPEKVKEAAELYRKAWENGSIYTTGSAGKINANKELFSVILNPFNAIDLATVELTDVTEEGEYDYTAIRYMFESSFMRSAKDTEFGVAKKATVGDMICCVYAYFGGSVDDFAGARAWLVEYNLVPADQDENEQLNEKVFCDFVNGAFGAGYNTDTPETIMTRGDLAEALYDIFKELEKSDN